MSPIVVFLVISNFINNQNGFPILVINKITYDEKHNDWTHFTAPKYQPDKVYFDRKTVMDTCNKMKKIASEVLSCYITCESNFKNGEISAPEAAQNACSNFQSLCDACKREEILNYAASLAIRKKDGSLYKKRKQVLAYLPVLVSSIDSRLLKYAYLYNLIAKNVADDTIEISIERLCIAEYPEEDHIILTNDAASDAAIKFSEFVKENLFSSENS